MGLPGRRTGVIAAMVAALLLALPLAARAQTDFEDVFGELPKVKGKVHTDGLLTVGQQETITVTGLRGKYRLQAYASPPPTAMECFQFNDVFCEPQPLFRVPGTRRFRSSKKGRAKLTFVMPPGYEVLNFKDPLKSHPVYFVNGQTVHVDIDTTIKRRVEDGILAISFPVASARAVVEVPPPPPSG